MIRTGFALLIAGGILVGVVGMRLVRTPRQYRTGAVVLSLVALSTFYFPIAGRGSSTIAAFASVILVPLTGARALANRQTTRITVGFIVVAIGLVVVTTLAPFGDSTLTPVVIAGVLGVGISTLGSTFAFPNVVRTLLTIGAAHVGLGLLDDLALNGRLFELTQGGVATSIQFGASVQRFHALFPHPNALGAFLAPILAIGITARLTRAMRFTSTDTLKLALVGAGLGLSISRGAILAVGATIALVVVLGSGGVTPSRRVRTAAVAVIGAVVLTTQVTLVSAVASSVLDRDYVANSSRVEIWSATIGAIEDRPLLGYGVGSTEEALDGRLVLGVNGVPKVIEESHNVFLTCVLWLGLPVGGAVLAGLVMAAFRVRSRNGQNTSLGAGACAIALNGTVESVLKSTPNLMMFILVVGLALLPYPARTEVGSTRTDRDAKEQGPRGSGLTTRKTVHSPQSVAIRGPK